jgi:hypothetical protein
MRKPTYTIILHQKRKKLGLTPMEYCVCDSIHKLSKEWCSKSKKGLAEFLGISEREVFRIIRKLLEKKLIEKDPKTKHLKTTQRWLFEVELEPDKMSGSMTECQQNYDKLSVRYDKMSDNNNRIIKNNIHYSGEQSPLQEIILYFREKVKELKNYNPEIDWAKEGKLIKQRLQKYSLEQLKELIDWYLSSKHSERLGDSLSVCLSANIINLWKASV